MSESTVFRTRVEVEEPEAPAPQRETPNLIEGRVDGALKDVGAVDEVERVSELEGWEIEHGRYGEEFLGIKEISGEFPLKLHFNTLDKYIKAEIEERGMEMKKENYQQLLDEMEEEIGSRKLPTYKRLEKLFGYINVVKKLKELNKKKELLTR